MPLLVYNRLPKCGSSTMLELLLFHANRTRAYTLHNSQVCVCVSVCVHVCVCTRVTGVGAIGPLESSSCHY